MPIFEFICNECGCEFEKLVMKSSENNEIQCPKCHSSNLEEKVSGFASVSTNGGGGASVCTPSGG
ncbi:MAG: zinc ribbon domain-containing protein [Acidobacteria bacterium]|nr:zinc ribbon domain-containing protein [Acidobacteriota bacterium]